MFVANFFVKCSKTKINYEVGNCKKIVSQNPSFSMKTQFSGADAIWYYLSL